MVYRSNYRFNHLLNRLSHDDQQRLGPFLTPVELKARQALEVANVPSEKIYFITSGLASLVAINRANRHQVEVTILGREGMTGLCAVLGTTRSPNEIHMTIDGSADCIAVSDFKRIMAESPTFADAMRCFAYVVHVQTAHAALANAKATLEERLARWLLMADDRMHGAELAVTHEALSWSLGVRRPGVTMALQELERQGLIGTGRRNLTVIDRDGLVKTAQGCYGVPESEYQRLFENPNPNPNSNVNGNGMTASAP